MVVDINDLASSGAVGEARPYGVDVRVLAEAVKKAGK